MSSGVSSSRVLEIFVAAIEVNRFDERDAFVRAACGADDALREQVLKLLAAHDRCEGFMARPVVAPDEAPTAVFDSLVGTTIGPYQLLEQIGAGGMGVIYLAEQAEPVRRQVALKVIKPGMDSRQILARFDLERQALSLMDHPHIARVLDAGTTNEGRPYFAMELVRGKPITRYCDEQRLTIRQRLELLLPVCQAIQHAHQKGVIHRDLKPSNILVAEFDGKPAPKVIDFGIAKAIDQRMIEGTSFSASGQFVGTLEYMSPEQAKVVPLDVDSRSDIYSLGVVAYELLTGSTPFGRERVGMVAWDELARIIRDEEPLRPSLRLRDSQQAVAGSGQRQRAGSTARNERLPSEIDWIVLKALEKDRTRRYESASELGSDIRRYLDDEPVSACPPSWRYRLGKAVRRHRRWIAAVALLVLAILTGLAATSWQAYRATLAERQARESEREAHEERDQKDAALRAEARQREIAEEQRRAAEEAASIAQAINQFLQRDLLSQADVGLQWGAANGREPDVRVRTLLDRASARVDQAFDGQPHVEAAVRETLGRTYLALGFLDEAERHLQRAVDLFRETLGPEHRQTLNCASGLGGVWDAQSRHAEARQLFQTTLALQNSRFGAEDSQTLTTKNALALNHHAQGQFDEAAKLLEEVVEARTKTLGPEHRQTLVCSSNLAAVYAAQGRLREATSLLESLLARRSRALGRDHPDTLQGINNLGRLYLDQQRFQEAKPLLEEVSAAMQRLLGEDHQWTLTALDNLAQLRLATDFNSETIALFARVARVREEKFGPRHTDTLLSKNNLAQVHAARGDLKSAIPLLEETWKLQQETLGESHAHTLSTQANLGAAYFKSGTRDQGIQVLERVFELRRDTLGNKHPDTLASQILLAECYELTKGLETALPLWERIVELRTDSAGPRAPLRLASLNTLGVRYWRAGKHAAAVAQFEECLRLRTEVLGPTHADTLETLANLGVTHKDAGRPLEAIPLLERAWKGASAVPQLRWISRQLADSYEMTQQLDRAESLLRDEVERNRRQPAARPTAHLQALSDLATNLHRQSRHDEASKTLREAIDVAAAIQLNSPGKYYLMLQLGTYLLADGHTAEAERWLTRGQDGFRASRTPLPLPLLKEIVELYAAQGAEEPTEMWRAALAEREGRTPREP